MLSDMTLRIGTARRVPACREVLDGAAPCAETQEYSRAIRCHAAVLATASPYFKARIMRCPGSGSDVEPFALDSSATSCCSCKVLPPSGNGRSDFTLVEFVEEDEVDAFMAILRCCYTGELSTATSVDNLTVSELLVILSLSDR